MNPTRSLLASLAVCLAAAAAADDPPKLVPIVSEDVKHDLSPPLMLMVPIDAFQVAGGAHEPFAFPKAPRSGPEERLAPYFPDEGERAGFAALGPMPPPILNFPGIGNVNGSSPPDTNGDVGPNHYVQWVNLSYAVWNKSGGLLLGPFSGNTIWQGFGTLCETRNNGDPIVLYDPIADRWMLSQLAFIDFDNYHQCIAVSQTSDPTGPWYRYDFLLSDLRLNDYPKFGVWPDAYYLAINEFQGPTRAWAGQGAIAFERAKMLVGQKARTVYFNLFAVNSNFGGALPADLDGPRLPPPGTPNPYVEMDDDAFGWTPIDRFSIWNFHVDWSNPLNSTFGLAGNPDQVIDIGAAGYPFDSRLCNWGACVPLPGGRLVDTLSDRLMFRLAYRNVGGHESLAVNHSVDVNGADRAGVRWYELRRSGGPWSIHQAGTHSPDATHRWMASAAMDGSGDFAIAYNAAGPSVNPEIRYGGRLPADPPGTMPQTEATLIAGGGTQTGVSRWGDYSMLAVDPTDDCTFWFTGEYYSTTSGSGWATRIGTFRFPSCVTCAQVGTPALAVAKDPGGTLVTWTPGAADAVQDLVRGSLGTLRASAGNFAAATAPCAADNLGGTTFLVTGPDPAPGEGEFFVLRDTALQCRGSFNDGSAALVADRDPGIKSAAGACP